MKKKLIIMGVILLIIFIVAVIFIFGDDSNKNNTTNNDIKEVVNKKNIEEKNINGIVFTNITSEYNGSISLLEYTIINKTNEVVNLGEYEIIIKNESGHVIANMVGFLDQDIQPNEEVQTGNTININLNDAASIELVLD